MKRFNMIFTCFPRMNKSDNSSSEQGDTLKTENSVSLAATQAQSLPGLNIGKWKRLSKKLERNPSSSDFNFFLKPSVFSDATFEAITFRFILRSSTRSYSFLTKARKLVKIVNNKRHSFLSYIFCRNAHILIVYYPVIKCLTNISVITFWVCSIFYPNHIPKQPHSFLAPLYSLTPLL